MRRYLILVLVLVFLSTFASAQRDPAAIFQEECAGCHGSDGEGGIVGPNIQSEDAEEIKQKVRQGEDGMPAFGPDQISDEELDELATHITQLGQQVATPSPAAPGFGVLTGLGALTILYLVRRR